VSALCFLLLFPGLGLGWNCRGLVILSSFSLYNSFVPCFFSRSSFFFC
jgi:hypothetical protein